MNAAAKIDPDKTSPAKPGELLLGEDWVSPEVLVDPVLRAGRKRRGLMTLNRSPLARKIIIFNLVALVMLVAGVLFLNPFRDSLVLQREQALVTEAQLLADAVAARSGGTLPTTFDGVTIGPSVEVFLFDTAGAIVARAEGQQSNAEILRRESRPTVITDFLGGIWDAVSGLLVSDTDPTGGATNEMLARKQLDRALKGQLAVTGGAGTSDTTLFAALSPVRGPDGQVIGAIAVASARGEIDALVRYEREQVLQMFVIALLVSIGLSLVLASTIANPLSDLAAAAELGRDRDARHMSPGRVRNSRPVGPPG